MSAAAMESATTTPAATAAEAEPERQARAVIGIGIIGIGRRIIITWGRGAIAVTWRRPVIGGLASTIFMHAGIIGIGIVGLDIARRMAGIVGADGGAGDQASASASRGAQAGIARARADDSAKRRAAQGAADGAACLLVTRRFARRGVAGAGGGVAAAEHVAVSLGLAALRLRAGIPLRIVIGAPIVLGRRATRGAAVRRTRSRRGILIVVIRRCACAIGQIGGRRIRRLRHSGSAQQGDRQGGDKRCAEHRNVSRFAPLGIYTGNPSAGSMSKTRLSIFAGGK